MATIGFPYTSILKYYATHIDNVFIAIIIVWINFLSFRFLVFGAVYKIDSFATLKVLNEWGKYYITALYAVI